MPKSKQPSEKLALEKSIEVAMTPINVNDLEKYYTPERIEELNLTAGTVTKVTPAVFQYNNIPPHNWSRNEYGLLNHINYVFNEDGSINWRAMVPDKYLVPNRQNFERKNQPIPKTIEGLEDKDLLILLDGIKYLAAIRGISDIDPQPTLVSETYVSVKTTVTFIPNYETDGKEVKYADLADAAIFNTNNFAKYYLNAIAANRGFVRAIRNALRLPILAADEIGEIPKEENVKQKELTNPTGPAATLQRKMNEKNISFDKIKATCLKKGDYENAESWSSLSDITTSQIVKIIDSLDAKYGEQKLI